MLNRLPHIGMREIAHKWFSSYLKKRRYADACIAEIQAWMLAHKLKLNDDKTEFVVFAPPRITKVNNVGVRIGDCDIEPNPCARNIEVYFDSSMNMNQQKTKSCKIWNYSLFCIRRIRRCLTVTATQQLVQALVLSRLDYCNSTYLIQGTNTGSHGYQGESYSL